MVKVHSADIAVAENAQGLSGDASGNKIVSDSLAFRDDVSGAGACQAVGQTQYLFFEPGCSREEQSGECVDPQGHSGNPCGHHAEQAGLGCHCVDHLRTFAPELSDQPDQGAEICQRGYLALHLHAYGAHSFALSEAVEVAVRR